MDPSFASLYMKLGLDHKIVVVEESKCRTPCIGQHIPKQAPGNHMKSGHTSYYLVSHHSGQGLLKGFDQAANIILDEFYERVCLTKASPNRT
ncbi:hypothetical protein Tco_1332063 [Tanacetum coccineum]